LIYVLYVFPDTENDSGGFARPLLAKGAREIKRVQMLDPAKRTHGCASLRLTEKPLELAARFRLGHSQTKEELRFRST